jgi:hypothetical protein
VKKPSVSELRQLNTTFERDSFRRYTGILFHVLQVHKLEQGPKLLGYLRSKRYDLLYNLADSLSKQKYGDATSHFVANQISQLIRKYPWDPTLVGLDPEAEATRVFLAAEHKCSRLNRRFRLYSCLRSPHEALLENMRGFIQYVIGSEPDMSSIYDQCDFGPGASIGVHGDATNLKRKLECNSYSVSRLAIGHAKAGLLHHAQYRSQFYERDKRDGIVCLDHQRALRLIEEKLRVIDNNKVSFVPKTAKTHRAIAVEPLLNTYLQKGVDSYMRLCLKRIGIDLKYQSKNQLMAREGSLDDSDESYATIDLSNASDSISIELCRLILPPKWFDLLNDIRSPSYEIHGKIFRYHKFCSQGNGFCFPLETLIFASICHSVTKGRVGEDFMVYGDDIIVRSKHFEKVIDLLKICGFATNLKKTFGFGAFRESCGADWYLGKDVRPYTLDHKLDSLQNIFKFLNLTRRNQFTTEFFSSSYEAILSEVPSNFQFWRPFKGNPDTGIDDIDSMSLKSRNVGYRKDIFSYLCLELSVSPVEDTGSVSPDTMYAACLRGNPSKRTFTYRRKTKTRIRFTSYSGSTSTWIPS